MKALFYVTALFTILTLNFNVYSVADLIFNNNSNYQIHVIYQAEGCASCTSGKSDWGVEAPTHCDVCNEETIISGGSASITRHGGQSSETIYVQVDITQDATYPPYKQNGSAISSLNNQFKKDISGDTSTLNFPTDFSVSTNQLALLKNVPYLATQSPLYSVFNIGTINNQTPNNFVLSQSAIRILGNQTTSVNNLASLYAANNVVTLQDNTTNSQITLTIDPADNIVAIDSSIQVLNQPVESKYSQLMLNQLGNPTNLALAIQQQFDLGVRGNTVIVTGWNLDLILDQATLSAKIDTILANVQFIDTSKNFQSIQLKLPHDWLITNGILQETDQVAGQAKTQKTSSGKMLRAR